MIYTQEELRNKITPIAEKYNILEVYLFGSYARGDATEDSDVDVLIRREGSSIRGWMIGELYEDLQETLQKKIDLITIEAIQTSEEATRSPWFIKNVERERVALYERR